MLIIEKCFVGGVNVWVVFVKMENNCLLCEQESLQKRTVDKRKSSFLSLLKKLSSDRESNNGHVQICLNSQKALMEVDLDNLFICSNLNNS